MEIDDKGGEIVQRYEYRGEIEDKKYGGEIEDKRWTWTKREQH
jgi:hypothetical protein